MIVCAATGVPAAAACEIVKTYTPATSGVNETLVTDEKVPAFVALVLVTNGAVVVEAAVTTEVPPAAPRTGVPAVKTIPVLFAVAPAGAVVRSTVITEASGTALALKASVIVKVAAELTATAAEVLVGAIAEVFVSVTVFKVVAAVDGTTERTPKPNAATATSEIRLKVVFVDMFFLSLVDPRNFRSSAWAEMNPS